MDVDQIEALLTPFLPAPPGADLLESVRVYLDLLLRWNQRLALTAVRDEKIIVTRHFGESLFAATQWFATAQTNETSRVVVDVGSGAGFPGIPIKLYAQSVQLILVEAHGKKATFLREVVRALGLRDAQVLNVRAESLVPEGTGTLRGDLVMLRAVEEFEAVLPIAAQLVASGGRLGLLIGAGQNSSAKALLPTFRWSEAVVIPQSSNRVVLTGTAPQ